MPLKTPFRAFFMAIRPDNPLIGGQELAFPLHQYPVRDEAPARAALLWPGKILNKQTAKHASKSLKKCLFSHIVRF